MPACEAPPRTPEKQFPLHNVSACTFHISNHRNELKPGQASSAQRHEVKDTGEVDHQPGRRCRAYEAITAAAVLKHAGPPTKTNKLPNSFSPFFQSQNAQCTNRAGMHFTLDWVQ